MRGFLSVDLSLTFIVFIVVTTKFAHSQYLSPKLNDKKYLDSIQNEVLHEVEESKFDLLEQARVVQHVTKNYIAAMLKQNLFKALRVLAEKELALDAMTMQERPRQPRQDEEAEGGSDEDEQANTTKKPSQILPQVANLIKAVFGGNINLTSYVESAATYLPRPIGNQLVGVVKLLANNPGSKYTTTTIKTTTTTLPTTTTKPTEAPATPVAVRVQTTFAPPTNSPQKAPIAPAKEEDEDEDENGSKTRQLDIPGLEVIGSIGGNIANILKAGSSVSNTLGNPETNKRIVNIGNTLGTILHPNNIADTIGGVFQSGQNLGELGNSIGKIFSGNNPNNSNKDKEKSKDSDKKTAKPMNQTETDSGFEEDNASSTARSMENKMNGIDVNNLAKEVRNSIGDLIKVVPDLFRGAHEAYKLLNSVSTLFQRLESDV